MPIRVTACGYLWHVNRTEAREREWAQGTALQCTGYVKRLRIKLCHSTGICAMWVGGSLTKCLHNKLCIDGVHLIA